MARNAAKIRNPALFSLSRGRTQAIRTQAIAAVRRDRQSKALGAAPTIAVEIAGEFASAALAD
jgi:hypothetical protein